MPGKFSITLPAKISPLRPFKYLMILHTQKVLRTNLTKSKTQRTSYTWKIKKTLWTKLWPCTSAELLPISQFKDLNTSYRIRYELMTCIQTSSYLTISTTSKAIKIGSASKCEIWSIQTGRSRGSTSEGRGGLLDNWEM